MRIGIWHTSTKPFDGERVRREPCGGTETAIAYTSEAMAARGADVKVWCNTEEPRLVRDVLYEPITHFPSQAPKQELDAFVLVRHLAALTVPVRTRTVAYWTHDNLAQPFAHGMFRFFEEEEGQRRLWGAWPLGELGESVDSILAVSRWQASELAAHTGLAPSRFEVIGNGLQPGIFDAGWSLDDRSPAVIYSLPPDRGLLPLLEIFAKARARVKNLELHAYSRSTIYGAKREDDEATYGELYQLMGTMPGVVHHDPTDQASLAEAMSRAMIYAYPTETDETFCISLLEAQAAGLVPISTARGAIPERITPGVNGFLVEGDPYDPVYQDSFVAKLIRLATSRDLRVSMAEAARASAYSEEYEYDTVAARMLARLEREVDGRDLTRRFMDVDALAPPYRATTPSGEERPLSRSDVTKLATGYRDLLGLAGA